MSEAPTHLWDPRLRPFQDDEALFQQEPFASVFQTYSQKCSNARLVVDLFQELLSLLSSDEWVELSYEFTAYCLGDEIAIIISGFYKKTLQLLVQILYLRYCHGDNDFGREQATRALLETQRSWFRDLSVGPRQLHLSFEDELSDRYALLPGSARQPAADDPEDSVSDDSSEINESEPDSDSDFEDASERLLMDPASESEMEEDSDSDSDGDGDPYSWCRNVDYFFNLDTESSILLATDASTDPGEQEMSSDQRRSKKRVICDLVVMRKVTPAVYNTPSFKRALQDSGLLDRFLAICRPGNLLETSHYDVELSFRYHSWRNSYGQLLERWTPPVCLRRLEMSPKLPHRPFDAAEFLIFFSTHTRMHPWTSNPMAAYMFLSLSAFKINCKLWLVPCLETLGFEARSWDLTEVYRDLFRHPAMRNEEEGRVLLESLDERLQAVILGTLWHRDLREAVNAEVFHIKPGPPSNSPLSHSKPAGHSAISKVLESTSGSSCPSDIRLHRRALRVAGSTPVATSAAPLSKIQKKNAKRRARDKAQKTAEKTSAEDRPSWLQDSCPNCAHKPEDQRCVRLVYVEENVNAVTYIGCALTSAPEGDRLRPLKVTPSKKTKKSKIYKRTQYISPAQLRLRYYEARSDDHPVWRDCGRDIVRFICRRGGKPYLVAGIRFRALSEETLKLMQHHHSLVRIHALRRRADMQAWAYGSMTGRGSRMPMGGMKGDGYAPYACHSGEGVDDIKALFRHAVDTDILVTAAKSIYSGIEKDLLEVTEESELNRFGRFGLTGYYCTNFISSVHSDQDIRKEDHPILHPCIQLSKENCGPEDYNFGMIRWGVAIRTEGNTVWLFDGNDEHGTIMPSQSSYDAQAASLGKHDNDNTKNERLSSLTQLLMQIDPRDSVGRSLFQTSPIPMNSQSGASSPSESEHSTQQFHFQHSVPLAPLNLHPQFDPARSDSSSSFGAPTPPTPNNSIDEDSPLQALQSATHEDLLRAQNAAYCELVAFRASFGQKYLDVVKSLLDMAVKCERLAELNQRLRRGYDGVLDGLQDLYIQAAPILEENLHPVNAGPDVPMNVVFPEIGSIPADVPSPSAFAGPGMRPRHAEE
ncbi:hypothetical protein C8R47DRAFT_1220555 [Mycena vitilis]|nr:hypothetical protein C8R47DRAFT_1220555 [Mycena vitilis]